MKTLYLIPLIFITSCSTAPRLAVRPQQPPATNTDGIRYPEVLHAYHLGRYADPNDDWIMHEQHVVYRVEENPRWDLHPSPAEINPPAPPLHDTAYAPTPVNDAILAEVNSQRLATAQMILQARTLSAALGRFQAALQQTKTNFQETAWLRVTVSTMQKRLDEIAAAQTQTSPTISTTNEPPDSLSP